MGYFPIMLDVGRRSVALIGTGAMARQKLQALALAEARVEIFDTMLDTTVAPLIGGRVSYTPRFPTAEDLKNRVLVIAAHHDPAVNRAVKRVADQMGVLINVVDTPAWSEVFMVSQLRRGDLVIGVSTSGRGPGLARRIREQLEPLFDDGWAERLKAFSVTRAQIRQRQVGHMRQEALAALEEQTMAAWHERLRKEGGR
ncbi:precorrin-2 dehydrogenase/sirohydrochlorin ferrochelatase family protein [Sulfobacillus harzensis]|uniref:precorrin-2 dehydrogenase n=1 Tax=Sulfobacillus harzensis TaxID=2729629 RepID=A0A7Y0L6E2_9FIRM|nr:bifunctional precorrin-2 dehydrogenase/sirohydrochlorin ferrochelatase [Sulfobacillus harzensis]NMP23878.1 bifunctional precorrin-2 dehydrogenase/sirohydrochlorin ferrochelatase [Sulfobacillus harzensis]